MAPARTADPGPMVALGETIAAGWQIVWSDPPCARRASLCWRRKVLDPQATMNWLPRRISEEAISLTTPSHEQANKGARGPSSIVVKPATWWPDKRRLHIRRQRVGHWHPLLLL